MAVAVCLHAHRLARAQGEITGRIQWQLVEPTFDDAGAQNAQRSCSDRRDAFGTRCFDHHAIRVLVPDLVQHDVVSIDTQEQWQEARWPRARRRLRVAQSHSGVAHGHRGSLDCLQQQSAQLRLDHDAVHDDVHARMIELE